MTKEQFDYSQYAESGHNRAEDFAEIVKLAEAQHAAECHVEDIEEQLKEAKKALSEIAEKKLPELMDSLGIDNYKTKTGVKVVVKETIRASLAVENRPKGWNWLEENGHGGMIKTNVMIGLKKGEIDKANQLVEHLLGEGLAASVERKVEPMTLTAFVKEQLTQGKDIPLDVFGVFRQRIAKVEI